ncbi:GPI mannosyltransferase 2 [Daktulosphaira vitifoliae]|uniref:GPI mannosyltransferase 2 n=1 Tax=Daktulosphaira vitifoliae TaxID=58002 RepID=UPI0021AAEAC4|nr:GPI mannosyltransferase 2 [Daktulosphaira vitifoliae]
MNEKKINSKTCRKTLWYLAIYSRLAVLLFQYICNTIIPDHKAQGVFISPSTEYSDDSIFDRTVAHLLDGFLRWDAQYFLHIYKYGYTYENSLAFFPFYPNLLWILTYIIPGNLNTLFIISGVVVNNILFIVTTIILFDLTLTVHKNIELSLNSSILFCINPAAIFFSAPYSESLYAFTTFYGMYNVYKNNIWKSSILFGISVMTRSNGILNAGFLLYLMIHSAAKRKYKLILKTFFGVLFIFFCFSIYQIYCSYLFCIPREIKYDINVVNYALKHNLFMPNNHTIAEWCGKKLAYTYVQDKYWNVGFLRYFMLKQIPNFILAFPCIFLILNFGINYFYTNRSHIINLGKKKNDFAFIVHAVFLTVFCIFYIHIQVTTRMLASSSPVLYWTCAKYFKFPIYKSKFFLARILSDKKCSLVFFYFVLYFIFGTALFVNFYPFT